MFGIAGIGIAVAVVFAYMNPVEPIEVTFDKAFQFGAASASYQIEGGWDADNKSMNIWDTVTHEDWGYTADRSNGDVAANSYEFYDKDIAALDNIGFDFYRFSISWSRIIPDGTKVNMKGIEYYNKLIDGLIAKGITPMITMYHWDLPQYIQDLGGFTNPMIVDYYKVYADALFEHFGDRVKTWITFNEPSVYCGEGYGYTTKAPAIMSKGVGDYLCAHHTLLANGVAYDLYKSKYAAQGGKIGICLNAGYSYPMEGTDRTYADKDIEFNLGKFANAIFSKDGGYPQVMIDEIGKKSENEGRPWSRLPAMSTEQKAQVKGKADFLALNYYSSGLARPRQEDEYTETSWWGDMDLYGGVRPEWKRAKSTWLYQVPDGLRDLLIWIKDHYDNPEVIISENGWSDDGEIEDDGRVEYLQLHLNAVSEAIEAGCKVTGYTVWSLTDNFEWKMGYTERFGIHYINFLSDKKERVPKKSALFFKQFLVGENNRTFTCSYCDETKVVKFQQP